MRTIDYNPLKEMFRVSGVLADSLEREFTSAFAKPSHFSPRADILEKDGKVDIHIELPGIKKEDIKLTVVDNSITVEGEKKLVNEENTRFFASERISGSFKRIFKMPFEVDRNSIDASFKDGILSISLMKTEKEATSDKNIEIK
jgi:HSP20 family protein